MSWWMWLIGGTIIIFTSPFWFVILIVVPQMVFRLLLIPFVIIYDIIFGLFRREK